MEKKRAPTKYEKNNVAENLDAVRGWATHGGKQAVAKALGVTRNTVTEWEKRYPEFAEALKTGATEAKGELLNSAFDQGVGYYREVTEVVKLRTWIPDKTTGKMIQAEKAEVVTYKKFFEPDPRMTQFLLMNRMREDYQKAPETPQKTPEQQGVNFTFDGGEIPV